jgi:hypothetical protein
MLLLQLHTVEAPRVRRQSPRVASYSDWAGRPEEATDAHRDWLSPGLSWSSSRPWSSSSGERSSQSSEAPSTWSAAEYWSVALE